jgi:hypothetical protein
VITEAMHLTRKRTAPPVGELVARIEPHVRQELPRVLRMLYDCKAPPLADEAPLPLSTVQEALLEGALEGIPRAAVIAAMEDLLRGKAGESVRRLRIQIEGCVGSALELPALFDLAFHEDETSLAPRLEEKLRAACPRSPPAIRNARMRGSSDIGSNCGNPCSNRGHGARRCR